MRRLVPGISLALLLAAPDDSGAQVTANTLLPCCTIESIDPGAGMLVLKNRTENWHETAPPNAVNKVRAVVIHHSHDPKVRLAAGVEWLKANSKDVSVALACTPLANDGGGRRGARTPSLKPPGTSSIRCSQ